MALSGSELAAYSSVAMALIAVTTQGVAVVKSRRREKAEIDDALDKSPMVREQLQLGNVGEAVKHLNYIIETQAKHITKQDENHQRQSNECNERIGHLESRNGALEAELDHLTRTNEELATKAAQLESEVMQLRAEVAQLRGEGDDPVEWRN